MADPTTPTTTSADSTISLIRHCLTALGVVLSLVGLGKYTGATDYLVANLDGVWAAISVVIGAITTLFGFFKARPAGFTDKK